MRILQCICNAGVRAPITPHGRPYPLRTVIVGEGKAAQAQQALKAMRQTELIPPGCCHIDVIEGSGPPAAESHPHGPVGGPRGKGKQQQRRQQQEEVEDSGSGSLFRSCSLLLLGSPVLRTIFGRWLSGGPRDPHLARCVSASVYLSACLCMCACVFFCFVSWCFGVALSCGRQGAARRLEVALKVFRKELDSMYSLRHACSCR